MNTPIPPLELRFRIAQLGGWENVEVLTCDGHGAPCEWEPVHSEQVAEKYLDPDGSAIFPDLWLVYDVRPRRKE